MAAMTLEPGSKLPAGDFRLATAASCVVPIGKKCVSPFTSFVECTARDRDIDGARAHEILIEVENKAR